MAQIDKPNLHFNTVLTTGDGTSSQAVTTGFQPDLIWWKNRGAAQNHRLQNSITGTGNGVYPSLAQAEDTGVSSYLQSFDSNGFTMGTDFASSNNFVSWSWKAGGTASSNTNGSITSNVSVNTTAGFSIVSYTGTGANATVGHGLGAVPKVVLTKNRSSANNWAMYHASPGNTRSLPLDLNTYPPTSAAYWNNTTPTSSVFSVSTGNDANKSGDSIIAFCFAEKKGFSKFGKYTGNGNADGTFVYTGFKPAFVIMRRYDYNDNFNWIMLDNKRPGYNVISQQLKPNLSDVEDTGSNTFADFLSNGFKLRNTASDKNANGGSFAYLAFAENPIVGSNNTPATAV